MVVRGFASTEHGGPGMTSTTTEQHKEQVKRMRKVMGGGSLDSVDSAHAWEALWSQEVTPWDLGGPTNVLISELERKHREEPDTLMWKTAFIPGCGSGYDLLSLARFWDSRASDTDRGTDETGPIERTVVGLEVAPTSLERAKTYLLHARDSNDGKLLMHTDIQLFSGNFFADPSTWTLFHHEKASHVDLGDLRGLESGQSFDFIFDYTFFCAIQPTLRKEWGQQIRRLLTTNHGSHDKDKSTTYSSEDPQRWQHPLPIATGGQLLTLMFPYFPTARPDSPGPPYPVNVTDYIDALNVPADSLERHNRRNDNLRLTTSLPYASKDTVPARRGQEFVGWWSFDTLNATS